MNEKQRACVYAIYSLLEHRNLNPVTDIVKPSEEAIALAKERVNENEM